MTILKRGNSANWYIQFQFNGKTYIRSSRTTSKKAAEQMEVEWKAKLHAEQHLGHRERLSLRQALEQFCESKSGTPNHRGLVAGIKVLVRLLPMHKAIGDLTAYDLERFRRDRLAEGAAPQTVKHNINLVRGAWKYARRLGFQ